MPPVKIATARNS